MNRFHSLKKIYKECLDEEEGVDWNKYTKRVRKELNAFVINADTTCDSAEVLIKQLKAIMKHKKIISIVEDMAWNGADFYSYVVFVE